MITFGFSPKQHVLIKAYGLNYPGRIQRCIWDGADTYYAVEFAENGKVDERTFLEDELEAATR